MIQEYIVLIFWEVNPMQILVKVFNHTPVIHINEKSQWIKVFVYHKINDNEFYIPFFKVCMEAEEIDKSSCLALNECDKNQK